MCNVMGESPKREPMHERALPALYMEHLIQAASLRIDREMVR
jgi:hypothetical protein